MSADILHSVAITSALVFGIALLTSALLGVVVSNFIVGCAGVVLITSSISHLTDQ